MISWIVLFLNLAFEVVSWMLSRYLKEKTYVEVNFNHVLIVAQIKFMNFQEVNICSLDSWCWTQDWHDLFGIGTPLFTNASLVGIISGFSLHVIMLTSADTQLFHDIVLCTWAWYWLSRLRLMWFNKFFPVNYVFPSPCIPTPSAPLARVQRTVVCSVFSLHYYIIGKD